MDGLPAQVEIIDVGCRDGLQMEKQFIDTGQKIALVNRLAALGFTKLEITSFVSPKAIPQMRDAAEVAAGIDRVPGVEYIALVPNIKGAELALSAGFHLLNVVISVSEAHNLANIRMTPGQSLERLKAIVALAAGKKVKVNVTLSTSFGCPFTGAVPMEDVIRMADRVLELGAASLTFADTTGMGNPVLVYRLMTEFRRRYPEPEVTLHFHNTRGMGMANILAGLQAGISSYDASVGGLGGCPFAPGASGNVATEDVVGMMAEMGIETGIDLPGLIETARFLEKIIGRPLPGQIMKAGRVCDLHPSPLPKD